MHRHKKRAHAADQDSPYWKRAHADRRVQFFAVLMLIAAATYVLTGDLNWLPHL